MLQLSFVFQGVKEMRCLKTQYCYNVPNIHLLWEHLNQVLFSIIPKPILDQPFNSKWGEGIWHLEFTILLCIWWMKCLMLCKHCLYIFVHIPELKFFKKDTSQELDFGGGGAQVQKSKVLALYKNNTAWREKTVVRVPLSLPAGRNVPWTLTVQTPKKPRNHLALTTNHLL
jgi:hypothetical protein